LNDLRLLTKQNHLTLLITKESTSLESDFNIFQDFTLFLIKYAFVLTDSIQDSNSSKPQFPPPGELFSQNPNGARYLDPKYSRWLSTDPALGEYASGSDAGCGGIYNHVNLSLYHYGGNNPVKYVDPDGKFDFPFKLNPGTVISEAIAIYYENVDHTSSNLQRDHISYFTEYKVMTTGKYISNYTSGLRNISHALNICGLWPLGLLGTCAANEWDGQGSNCAAQDFCSFFYSAQREIENLKGYSNCFSSTIPDFSLFLNDQIGKIEKDIKFNKYIYYLEYARRQEQYSGNSILDNKIKTGIRNLEEFQTHFPSYFNLCEDMLRSAKNDAEIIEGLPIDFYYEKFIQEW
jgi:RHS repeat-associated protein